MDIKSYASGVNNAGTGATDLIALWTSATVIGANANFAYDGTTFKLALDMRMNEAGTAAAQAVIRNRANTGSVAHWGASTNTGGTIEAFGNSHATKANYVELGAGGTAYLTTQPAGITASLSVLIAKSTGPSLTIQDTAGALGTNCQPQLNFKDNSGTIGLVGWNSNTSYDLTFRNYSSVGSFNWIINTTSIGSVDQNGKWTIGATSGTQFHAVNGRGVRVTYGASGVTGYFELDHTSNTANSGAALFLSVAGGSGGNAFTGYSVTGVTDWVSGVNNGSSDRFEIASASSALGSNVCLYATTTKSIVVGAGGLATNATDGFLYIPTCAGTPTGTPTTQGSTCALIFDTTNKKLYVYSGSWLGGTVPGVFV